jgi:hypothetical protein
MVEDVPGGTFILSRAGLLRLIAHGTSPKALEILDGIANGLVQFFSAEKIVHLAETSRRTDLLAEKAAREKKEAEQLKLIEKEREAKKATRKARREALRKSGERSPDQTRTPETSFRTLIRQSATQHDAEVQKKHEAMMSLRESRKVLDLKTIEELPDHKLVADPSEAKVDESMSYLQSDPTRMVKDVPAPTEVVLTEEQGNSLWIDIFYHLSNIF